MTEGMIEYVDAFRMIAEDALTLAQKVIQGNDKNAMYQLGYQRGYAQAVKNGWEKEKKTQ